MNRTGRVSVVRVAMALLAVWLAMPIAGCKQGVVDTSYKSLAITGDLGTESMKVIMKLYNEKLVDREEYATARDVYRKYKASYDAAVEALASYKRVENEGSEATLVSALGEMAQLAARLSAMLVEFQGRRATTGVNHPEAEGR